MAKHWSDDEALIDAISNNLYHALPRLPRRLVKIDVLMKEFEMPFSHIQILCMLSERERTIGEISANLGIAKPNITPLLDSMNKRGLLERCRSEKDRRIVNVRLLPKGQELALKLRERIAGQVREWPEEMSLSDIKRLNNALSYLIEVTYHLSEAEQDN